jgi:hypothetical protein
MVRNSEVILKKFNVEEICISVIRFSKNMNDCYYYSLICKQKEFILWQIKLNYVFFYSSGSAGQRGLWPPRSRGFVITHNDAAHSVGPSGRVISSSQRPLPDNTQQTTQTNIHAPCGIRTHDRSRRAAVDWILTEYQTRSSSFNVKFWHCFCMSNVTSIH